MLRWRIFAPAHGGSCSATACLLAIGRVPDTALFAGQVELDPSGYIVADETTRTSVPGVFAVGDARTKAVRQIVTAVADGAVAAHYAEEFLLEDAVKDKNLS